MVAARNRYLAKQLRKGLRACRWDAGTIALRAYLSRSLMARVLVGDTSVSLATYELVADQLELTLELSPWTATGQPPASVGAVPTVVDRALDRIKHGSLFAPPASEASSY